jgi:hypothetical protein
MIFQVSHLPPLSGNEMAYDKMNPVGLRKNRTLLEIFTVLSILILLGCGSSSDKELVALNANENPPNPTFIPSPFLNQFPDGAGTDIVIIYGQSNAVGWGDFNNNNISYEASVNLKAQKCVTNDNSKINSECVVFNKIKNPSDIYEKGYYSAWTEFSRFLESMNHRDLVIVNAGYGAKSLNSLLPQVPDDGIKEYENMIFATNATIDFVGKENINSLSVFWLQGESDILEITNAGYKDQNEAFKNYFLDLNTLYALIQSDLDIPEFYFYFIRLGSSETNEISDKLLNDLGYWQIQFTKENDLYRPLSVLPVNFSSFQGTLSSDGIHYTPYGYDLLGRDVAINYLNYLDNLDASEVLYQGNHDSPPTIIIERPY